LADLTGVSDKVKIELLENEELDFMFFVRYSRYTVMHTTELVILMHMLLPKITRHINTQRRTAFGPIFFFENA